MAQWAWELRLEKEEGQTLAEYALILALIAVVVVVVVATLGGTISSMFSPFRHASRSMHHCGRSTLHRRHNSAYKEKTT